CIFHPLIKTWGFQRGWKIQNRTFRRGFLSVVIATGFEPVTVCLEGRCSIQLSYATFYKTTQPLARWPKKRCKDSYLKNNTSQFILVFFPNGFHGFLKRGKCSFFGPCV